MMRTFGKAIVAVALLFLSAPNLQATTPDHVGYVVKRLKVVHPLDVDTMRRDFQVSITQGEAPQRVTISRYPNFIEHGGATALHVFVHEAAGCGYSLTDEKLDGEVDHAEFVCIDGEKEERTAFFEDYGAAQALFDRVVSEVLKQ